ncbi:Uncharacterised protein [Mycobacteroides abscessus subsp. massiliense]|nr:Uncharacterised protein [Mycobacteroides abscessus subsp. massiliense]
MLSRFETPGLASLSKRISRSLSVCADLIFLAETAGSSSKLINPAGVEADLLIFTVGSCRS